MEIELRQVGWAALRWGWLIVLATVFSGLLAFVLTKGQTATYSATTTLLVNPQQVTSSTDNSALQASRSQADTYVRLVESGPVLDRVINELDLSLTRRQLDDKIDATVVMNTQLIEISVSDPSAKEAARMANAVAGNFEQQIEDLTIGRLQENLQQAKSESDALRARQAEIDAELADLDTNENESDSEIQQTISALKEERTRTQETTADLESTVRTLNQQLATMSSPVEVADEAQAAREPDSPKPLLITALGLFLGFLVGCGIAAVLEVSDRKIRQETDIGELTDSRLLAIVPIGRRTESRNEPTLVSSPDSGTSESIRMLRTHLSSFVESNDHAVLTVLNAGAGDVTSDIAASLGVAMAQYGVETTIIDANLRDGRMDHIFSRENNAGVMTELSGNSPSMVADIMPQLRLVTAGSGDGHPAQMVGSAAFQSLVSRVGAEADVVIIDTPPALEYSDALSVASVSDGTIIVAKYNATVKDDLAALSETLRNDEIRLLGIVMLQT